MSTGQFYELHSRLHGQGAFGPRTAQGMRMLPGEAWRASRLSPSPTPYGRLGYLWHGSPDALRLGVGLTASGSSASLESLSDLPE